MLSSVTTLAIASRRIEAEQSAFSAPSSGRCTPTTFNRSDLLAGTSVAVSPLPGSFDASPYTQISLLGAPAAALGAVHVRGSQTGAHGGHLRAYSQGDGASFVPSHPFAAGETVHVSGKVTVGARARAFAFDFVVAHQDALPYVKPNPPSGKDPQEMQHFRSRPDLPAPVLAVTSHSAQATPGDLFTAPYAGPGTPGPAIYDEAGNLVWFDPLPANLAATNLQVQQLGGQPVLSWWQGYIPPEGFGEGEEIVDNTAYQQIMHVHAGNGYKADLHDFHITPYGTAMMTVFDPIDCNLSEDGGPAGGAVTDTVMEELDLKTGLVRREWHSLNYVPIGDSYSSPTHSSPAWPFDYFHLNSIDQRADGTTLISARNTSALYELNTLSGQILTRIGGRHSSVALAAGAATAYQHDATALANGTISVFDNGAVPKVHSQSRGMILAVDPHRRTDTVVAQYEHAGPLSSGSQGNVQVLSDGDVFVGWGAHPYFSEFTPQGQLLYDAHMHGSYQSYRAYRFPWTGAPASAPSVAASAANSRAPVHVYASWNGDTRATSWRVLGGVSASQLEPVAAAARTGFETTIVTPLAERFVAVQALDDSGAVLGTSRMVAG